MDKAPWKIVARHKTWARNVTICEMRNGERGPDRDGIERLLVRFTARVWSCPTVRLYEGPYYPGLPELIQNKAIELRSKWLIE